MFVGLVFPSCYRASPNEVTSRSMVDPLRRNDFIYGVVVTPFDEVLYLRGIGKRSGKPDS